MKIFRRRVWTLRDTVVLVVGLFLGTLTQGVSLGVIWKAISMCMGV
jgi:hypothetical protein